MRRRFVLALTGLLAACGASALGTSHEAPAAVDSLVPLPHDAAPPDALPCGTSTCGAGEYCLFPCYGTPYPGDANPPFALCEPLPPACGGTFSCACVAGNSGVYKNDAGAYRSCSPRGAPGYGCCDPSGTVWAPQICD